jgi:hypothetical protein
MANATYAPIQLTSHLESDVHHIFGASLLDYPNFA